MSKNNQRDFSGRPLAMKLDFDELYSEGIENITDPDSENINYFPLTK